MKQLFFKACMAMLCAFSSLKLYACEQSLIRATIISTEYLTTSTTIDVAVMLQFEGKASQFLQVLSRRRHLQVSIIGSLRLPLICAVLLLAWLLKSETSNYWQL